MLTIYPVRCVRLLKTITFVPLIAVLLSVCQPLSGSTAIQYKAVSIEGKVMTELDATVAWRLRS